MKIRMLAAVASVLLLSSAVLAEGISDNKISIGVMADMSGVYADICGKGCVTAAQMAVDDFGGQVAGKPVEIVSADDKNNPDEAAAIAQRWIVNQGVDVITGLVSSSVTAAVLEETNAAGRMVLISGAGSNAFSTSSCSPNIAHWTYDVVALANGTVKPMVQDGKRKWFFITADYAFGHALEGVASNVITANGGTVAGSVRVPLGTHDFSPYVRQALDSGADVVALANAGDDFVHALEAAAKVGLTERMAVVGLLVFLQSARALDPAIAADMRLTTGFYWDMDEATRQWSARFKALHGDMPSMVHAGVYSAVSHYLRNVAETGTDSTAAVMSSMKKNRPSDFFARRARLRPDGRMIHDMYQVRIKKASERRNPDDIFAIETISTGTQVYDPMAPSCSFR